MGVVPISARLVDLPVSAQTVQKINKYLTHCEIIREVFTGRNTALGHSDRTIHLVSPVHVQTVEMKARGLVVQVVLNVDNDSISHTGCDGWQRPLAVDAHDRAHKGGIRIGVDPADIEIIGDHSGMRHRYEAQGKNGGQGRHRCVYGRRAQADFVELRGVRPLDLDYGGGCF